MTDLFAVDLFRRLWLETDMSTSPSDHDHGKGGTDSAATVGKSTGPSYVYYHLYTKLGAFESTQPLYHNDRFIGRIPSKSVTPPRTVASLKRCLCKLEGLSEPDKALVYTPLSSPAPIEDSARLSFHAPSGPGLSEQDPIALVVESEKRIKEVTQSDKLPERSDDTDIHYVYYRVYSSEGDEKAKTSFDETDSSLGRINSLFVTPPHNVGSLKACIAKFEGIVDALYQDMELFEDVDSDAAMSDSDVISFQGDTHPGSDEGNPVALVNAAANTAAPTPGKVFSEYPLDIAATKCALLDRPEPKFTKRARSKYTYVYKAHNPIWLSIERDEIFYTDGVILSMESSILKTSFPGYMAINSKGEKGFVCQERSSLKLGSCLIECPLVLVPRPSLASLAPLFPFA
ncbi:uncharacterized protein LACBIDRAFT_295204 [Laccaria bicolor S238N-H82]|uniref:Predicted protein n=1 Tax=Laccaria bicolor (strain S238N-H82 / ATCC MYA-4686) TaxID=486041 RepID=B0DPB0_LACBS|nr:uncharacterized protein LACBIDRAFT_295204 [Laccaria bicolor S238N-H82]EDR03583.1 predicted protein [Laccaria bicolor S238N-H82]|eukprot:XP_001885731.1 predicted protein [Laccaria bicolor S238N-H82]